MWDACSRPILYRLILLKFRFYAINVDAEIWRPIDGPAEMERLGQTQGRSLRSGAGVRAELLQEWQTLIAREADRWSRSRRPALRVL
jgi:hypothetical protein